MPEALILDVGHGNCTIVFDNSDVAVFDAPLGSFLSDSLHAEGIDRVRLAVASHSDADHLGGMIGLLLDPGIRVDELRCNPDAQRRSDFFEDLKSAVAFARNLHGTKLRLDLTSDLAGDLSFGLTTVEVLYPPPELALGGVGGVDLEGRRISTNRMSVVVRVSFSDVSILLTGDLDTAGLAEIQRMGTDIAADVLVFPHHGGLPGDGHPGTFARSLVGAVRPRLICFSIGRLRHDNPNPAVVSAVRDAMPDSHIACTQLSTHCASTPPPAHAHLTGQPSTGQRRGHCCAGSIVVRAGEALSGVLPPIADHRDFVSVNFPGRLCR